ncbi:MAG: gamma-glutamylcyclotransferase [Tatlockia sp.]|nr:gamma-glutamylcyclotransferase [Tatlockia sp.]
MKVTKRAVIKTPIQFILLITALNLSSISKAEQVQINSGAAIQESTNCWPAPNTKLAQFIIGYGSLMEEQSKRKASTQVGENYPIYLKGFKRGWIEQGNTRSGFGITFLGIEKDPSAKINAVYYKLDYPKAIYDYDKRENIYCRVKVSPSQIMPLSSEKIPSGEYWIYFTKASRVNRPSPEKPLFQSYVDLFLSGCFELEEKYHLENFAENCIKTTHYWSDIWINDRAKPRTGLGNIDYSSKIDHLLAAKLPLLFKQIKIEKK